FLFLACIAEILLCPEPSPEGALYLDLAPFDQYIDTVVAGVSFHPNDVVDGIFWILLALVLTPIVDLRIVETGVGSYDYANSGPRLSKCRHNALQDRDYDACLTVIARSENSRNEPTVLVKDEQREVHVGLVMTAIAASLLITVDRKT